MKKIFVCAGLGAALLLVLHMCSDLNSAKTSPPGPMSKPPPAEATPTPEDDPAPEIPGIAITIPTPALSEKLNSTIHPTVGAVSKEAFEVLQKAQKRGDGATLDTLKLGGFIKKVAPHTAVEIRETDVFGGKMLCKVDGVYELLWLATGDIGSSSKFDSVRDYFLTVSPDKNIPTVPQNVPEGSKIPHLPMNQPLAEWEKVLGESRWGDDYAVTFLFKYNDMEIRASIQTPEMIVASVQIFMVDDDAKVPVSFANALAKSFGVTKKSKKASDVEYGDDQSPVTLSFDGDSLSVQTHLSKEENSVLIKNINDFR